MGSGFSDMVSFSFLNKVPWSSLSEEYYTFSSL